MLRIELADEPMDFEVKVRQPGSAWLALQIWNLDLEAPDKTKFPDYWSECRDALRLAYGSRCCFTGTYLRKSEVIPVEHFLAKKDYPREAYEWKNYRYCCSRINSRKSKKYILDPAIHPLNTVVFHLDLVTGSIYPNPQLKIALPSLYNFAAFTISVDGLNLDDALYRDERTEFWSTYLASSNGVPEKQQLEKGNNFVWSEAVRQGQV